MPFRIKLPTYLCLYVEGSRVPGQNKFGFNLFVWYCVQYTRYIAILPNWGEQLKLSLHRNGFFSTLMHRRKKIRGQKNTVTNICTLISNYLMHKTNKLSTIYFSDKIQSKIIHDVILPLGP